MEFVMSLKKVDFLNFFTKPILLKLSKKLGNTTRKSWKKDKIISTFDECLLDDIASQCTEQQLIEFLERHNKTIDNSKTIKSQVLQVFGAMETTPQSPSEDEYLPTLPKHCGHMNAEGAKFCSTCGKALPQDDGVYLRYWASKWWKAFVEKEIEVCRSSYEDIHELLSDTTHFGYDLQPLEWIRFEEGQFVEFDDEGGVYVFVAHKIESNLRYYDSTQEEGYNYEVLRWYDGFYGPSPKDLQTLMYRMVERDTHFAPTVKFSVNQQLLATINAQWRTLSKEEFTKQLCKAVVYVEGSV